MARQTVTFTDKNHEWLEEQIRNGEYSSISELVNTIIRDKRRDLKPKVNFDMISNPELRHALIDVFDVWDSFLVLGTGNDPNQLNEYKRNISKALNKVNELVRINRVNKQ